MYNTKNMQLEEDLFSKLNEISKEQNINPSKDINKNNEYNRDVDSVTNCLHEEEKIDKGNLFCNICGLQLNTIISFDKDRFYGCNDNKYCEDPSRSSFRKDSTLSKGLVPDCEKLNLPRNIVSEANIIYTELTKDKIYRGNKRKGIIFACIYHSFRLNNDPKSCETLVKLFDIKQSIALKGLKFSHTHLNITSVLVQNKETTVGIDNLIKEIMKEFNAHKNIPEILVLAKKLIDKSSLLNRSRPLSVAWGIVKYYMMSKNVSSEEVFNSKMNISNLTLNRITREIEFILSFDI